MHFAGLVDEEALIRPPPTVKGWAAVTLCFGLLVTVQGFETSRYLGDEYDATTRIRSMRLAQWISTGIYLVYILLLTWSFRVDDIHLDETAIIDMMAMVAPVLPVMLVAAALAAQFSAAVADTSGAGGLVVEISQQRAKARHAYLMLVVVGLVLTWVADVFEIIGYASRAFAAYYAVESAIAAVSAWRGRRRLRAAFFALLVLLAVAIAVFGTSVEG